MSRASARASPDHLNRARWSRPLALGPLLGFACLAVLAGTCAESARGGDRERLLALLDERLAPAPRFSDAPEAPPCTSRTPAAAGVRMVCRTEPLPLSDVPAARRLTRRVEARAARRPADAEAQADLALAVLLGSWSPSGRDRAVDLLRSALEQEPDSPRRHNDLVAALLLRGEVDDRPWDLVEALEILAPDCRSMRTSSRETSLHRSLAVDALGLRPEPTFDPETTAAASRPAADAATLRHGAEASLGDWGVELTAGRPVRAAASLANADALASSLGERTGDRLLADAVEVVGAATREGADSRLAALADAHAGFRLLRGARPYSPCDGPSRTALTRIGRELAQHASPFHLWAEIDRAVCAYFDKDLGAAEEILRDVLAAIGSRSYPALEGRCRWLLGLTFMVQARFSEAEAEYRRAIALFERIGETGSAVYVRSLRAKNFEHVGMREEAWRQRRRALAGRSRVDPERANTILEEAVHALRRQGRPSAALIFLEEQIRGAAETARGTGAVDLLAYALLDRAALATELGLDRVAARDLDRVERLWHRLPAGHESQERLGIELEVEREIRRLPLELPRALAAVDRALGFFRAGSEAPGDQVEVLRLRRIRARLNLSGGRIAAAEQDLEQGIAEAERQRAGIVDAEERARFLAREQDLFEELVRLRLDHRHDALGALRTWERAGNRLLLDVDDPRQRRRPDLAGLDSVALDRFLPPGTLVVRFGALTDRLLVWTIFDGRLELEQKPVGRAALADRIASFRRALLTPADRGGPATLGDALSDLLLPARLAALEPGAPLLLVPDPVLLELPFAALPSPAGEGCLLERHVLSYSPSLALWSRPRDGGAPPAAGVRSALIVSDPAFDPQRFPDLPRLDAARRALPEQAELYARRMVLRGAEATKSALVAALPGHEVLIFDGHGLTDRQAPDRGGLVLAPETAATEDSDPSLLRPGDLDRSGLESLELVVLAACSTTLAPYPQTSEVAGLAGAFLARGVPRVITAAWEVEDRHAAGLFLRFHREFIAGESAEAALRRAQLALLDSGDPSLARPSVWAAYQVFRRQ